MKGEPIDGNTMTVDELFDNLNAKHLAIAIAPYNKISNGVRKSKPDENGLIQYVWRMVRFHTGEDLHMPVTANWWLKNYLDSKGILPDARDDLDLFDEDRSAALRKRREITNEVEDRLEDVIDEVIEIFGRDGMVAARRWKKAGLF